MDPSAGGRARAPGLWIRLLKVGGVALYLDPLVLVLLGLVTLAGDPAASSLQRLTLLGVVLGSVLVHETGHALAARLRGLRVGGIYLHLVPFAYVERGRPSQELFTALAGPATNLAVVGVLLLASGGGAGMPWLALERWLAAPLWMALGVNALMGVVNLIPALPADGGRALRALLMLRVVPATAYEWTARVGTFVGALLLLLALVLHRWPDSGAIALLGGFVIMVAWREHQQGVRERRAARARQGP